MTTVEQESGRSPATEAWLDDVGVKWRFEPDLEISRIDKKRSHRNQARLEALDQEVVDRYAADLERGDVFPAVLALDPGGTAKLWLLGGNHRLAAHVAAKRKTIAAYVVEAEPETQVRLTYEDNRRHGMPPSDTERIVQAMDLLAQGWSNDAAAACVGLTSARISQENTMYKATKRAKDLGIDMKGFGALPRWARYQLGRIVLDPVFVEASALAITARLKTDEVRDLVTRLLAAKSEADALQIIGLDQETYRERIQRGAGGRIRSPKTARAELLTFMRSIRRKEADAVVSSTPGVQARADLAKEVSETIAYLETVRKALR